jgi:hypothetical protein
LSLLLGQGQLGRWHLIQSEEQSGTGRDDSWQGAFHLLVVHERLRCLSLDLADLELSLQKARLLRLERGDRRVLLSLGFGDQNLVGLLLRSLLKLRDLSIVLSDEELIRDLLDGGVLER